MNKIKEYKEIIVVGMMVLTFGWWLMSIDAKASGAAKSIDQLTANQTALTALIADSRTTLNVYLTLMGFDKEKAHQWASLPRSTPLDSLNKPVINSPWLSVSEDLSVGVMLKVDDSLGVRVDTLWNFNKKNKK